MKLIRNFLCFIVIPVLVGCDLQPKITSIPDSVGDFITSRYPALLADPYKQPDIYASAVSDYGVYASPDLKTDSGVKDYVLYSSVNDYILVPDDSESEKMQSTVLSDDYLSVPVNKQSVQKEIVVAKGDTLYSLAKKNNISKEELAKLNNLKEPYTLSVGQKLKLNATEQSPVVQRVAMNKMTTEQTKIQLKEISVSQGDTLYSLSRKYSIPVNDLAVLNNLTPPFSLSVGQKIKVPNLMEANQYVQPKEMYGTLSSDKQMVQANTNNAVVSTEKTKISSDPTKKLPAITSRSSSKFSWPVRGKVLSSYGAKTGGLFNDGINISASKGTAVKAAENGVVAYAGNEVKGMGNLVIIQHAEGWMTVYAHMDSMSVRRGTKVSVGQSIGTVGSTGKVDSSQLHFEIRKGTKAYNPSSYLK